MVSSTNLNNQKECTSLKSLRSTVLVQLPKEFSAKEKLLKEKPKLVQLPKEKNNKMGTARSTLYIQQSQLTVCKFKPHGDRVGLWIEFTLNSFTSRIVASRTSTGSNFTL